MKLYAFPPSPRARKVMAVLAHLELPYELQIVDLTKGEQKKPEYLKLNPNGKMPTLVDADFVLWESDCIPHLKAREWVAGKSASVADYALAAPLAYASACRFPIDGLSNVKSWFARVQQLEGWQETERKPAAAAA